MINKVILMGRLTRDPEVRHTSTGKAVCSFSIAIDNGYGENRQTDFINCVAWQNQAEFLGRYFTKGMMVDCCGPNFDSVLGKVKTEKRIMLLKL